MELTVPEQLVSAVKSLLRIAPGDLDLLAAAFDEADAAARPSVMASAVAERVGLDRDTVQDVTILLLSLYLARERDDAEPEEFVDAVFRAVARMQEGDSPMPEEMSAALKQFLLRGMNSQHSVGVTAKALDVWGSRERVFCAARILSDLRPIFASSPSAAPSAMLVGHTLEVAFHPDNDLDRTEKFYVAMRRRHLEALRDAVERALAKHSSLTQLGTLDGVSFLEDE